MYNGHVFLWNYNTQSLVKSFEVSDQPVRCSKFVVRKQWIVFVTGRGRQAQPILPNHESDVRCEASRGDPT